MRSLRTAMKSSPCSLQLEKAAHNNEDPTQPKINKLINYLKTNKTAIHYEVELSKTGIS